MLTYFLFGKVTVSDITMFSSYSVCNSSILYTSNTYYVQINTSSIIAQQNVSLWPKVQYSLIANSSLILL